MDYSGMTLNERLYHSGKMTAFEEARDNKDITLVKKILLEIDLTESQIDQIIKDLGLSVNSEEE